MIGYVFTIFALFSITATVFNVGLSPILQAFMDFYAGFRANIFWPITSLLRFDIPENIKDLIIVWTVSGAIAVHTFLWFVDRMNKMATEAYNKAVDLNMKQSFIEKFGQEKYDEELEFVTRQMNETTRPGSGIVFKAVTVIFSCTIGLLGFIYVAIINPSHRTIAITGRQLLGLQVVVIVVILLIFFAINYMLPNSVSSGTT